MRLGLKAGPEPEWLNKILYESGRIIGKTLKIFLELKPRNKFLRTSETEKNPAATKSCNFDKFDCILKQESAFRDRHCRLCNRYLSDLGALLLLLAIFSPFQLNTGYDSCNHDSV